MTQSNSIDPFPSDIDRRDFGNWLSGFVDGEGTFGLVVGEGRYGQFRTSAYFRIALRDDDLAILLQVKSFFQCGYVYRCDNSRHEVPNARPVATYVVSKTSDLVSTVIAHFDRCTLRAKKASDYRIWREAVLLRSRVMQRPPAYRPHIAPNRCGGLLPRWTDQEREHFRHLVATLRQQRAYSVEGDN